MKTKILFLLTAYSAIHALEKEPIEPHCNVIELRDPSWHFIQFRVPINEPVPADRPPYFGCFFSFTNFNPLITATRFYTSRTTPGDIPLSHVFILNPDTVKFYLDKKDGEEKLPSITLSELYAFLKNNETLSKEKRAQAEEVLTLHFSGDRELKKMLGHLLPWFGVDLGSLSFYPPYR